MAMVLSMLVTECFRHGSWGARCGPFIYGIGSESEGDPGGWNRVRVSQG